MAEVEDIMDDINRFQSPGLTCAPEVFPVVVPGVDVHKIEMKQRKSGLSRKTWGWLLVSSVVTTGPSPPKVSVETSYRGISGSQMLLTKDAMMELRTHLSFTQLRFHCSKLQGRTFHVTTIANRSGEAVVQYFSGQTDVFPASCGSFVRMKDDNSVLAGDCAKWGLEGNSYFVGKWGHAGFDQNRVYDHSAFILRSSHWTTQPGGSRWECDDYLIGLSTGDFWKVFTR